VWRPSAAFPPSKDTSKVEINFEFAPCDTLHIRSDADIPSVILATIFPTLIESCLLFRWTIATMHIRELSDCHKDASDIVWPNLAEEVVAFDPINMPNITIPFDPATSKLFAFNKLILQLSIETPKDALETLCETVNTATKLPPVTRELRPATELSECHLDSSQAE
jgi:hypothetical protein